MNKEPTALRDTMKSYPGRWWIAGGWAIDLFLGRQTRLHKDIDVAVPRSEQADILAWPEFRDASFFENHMPSFWNGEELAAPIHELQITTKGNEEIEFLLNDFSGSHWIYRRDPRITLPLEFFPKADIPFLPPEIVLLYKSKNPLEKDKADFENALAFMSVDQKLWLKNALIRVDPSHAWIASLRSQ